MSSEYMTRKEEAKEVLATAREATVDLISKEQYQAATGDTGRSRGYLCAITATSQDGTKHTRLEVPSFAAACQVGLLCPRFVTEHQRNKVWPRTFTAHDDGKNPAATAGSASRAVQTQPTASQLKTPFESLFTDPVVFVTPIDRATFEEETGIVSAHDTNDFCRVSGSLETPEGDFEPDDDRQFCVRGWNVVKAHLTTTHLAPYTMGQDNTAHYRLLGKQSKGQRGSHTSQSSRSAGRIRAEGENIGEGPSGTAGQHGVPSASSGGGGREASPAYVVPQVGIVEGDSRSGVPWDWKDILNKPPA
jgi:hypothetical protein